MERNPGWLLQLCHHMIHMYACVCVYVNVRV